MPSPEVIGLLALEKKIFFKGFYHIWAWLPFWSCDQNHLNKLSFPRHKEYPYEFEFNWPSGFRGEDVWKCWRTDDRRTGILLAHPWAYGSGELNQWAQETLLSTLQQNEHQICIAYVLDPAENEIRITLSIIKWFRPISEISLHSDYYSQAIKFNILGLSKPRFFPSGFVGRG